MDIIVTSPPCTEGSVGGIPLSGLVSSSSNVMMVLMMIDARRRISNSIGENSRIRFTPQWGNSS
eukprot:scaffold44464_cov31-Attheya_sp.AAC.1